MHRTPSYEIIKARYKASPDFNRADRNSLTVGSLLNELGNETPGFTVYLR